MKLEFLSFTTHPPLSSLPYWKNHCSFSLSRAKASSRLKIKGTQKKNVFDIFFPIKIFKEEGSNFFCNFFWISIHESEVNNIKHGYVYKMENEKEVCPNALEIPLSKGSWCRKFVLIIFVHPGFFVKQLNFRSIYCEIHCTYQRWVHFHGSVYNFEKRLNIDYQIFKISKLNFQDRNLYFSW